MPGCRRRRSRSSGAPCRSWRRTWRGYRTRAMHVQLCGDAHVQNLGSFAAPDGKLVFDFNDFDETIRGPWEWDVKRMATSIVLAGSESGHNRTGCRDAVETFVGELTASRWLSLRRRPSCKWRGIRSTARNAFEPIARGAASIGARAPAGSVEKSHREGRPRRKRHFRILRPGFWRIRGREGQGGSGLARRVSRHSRTRAASSF